MVAVRLRPVSLVIGFFLVALSSAFPSAIHHNKRRANCAANTAAWCNALIC
jgi:hypothetical protein